MTTEAATPWRKAFTIRETCRQVNCSESFLRAQMRSGALRYRKVGRRVFIPVDAIDSFLAGEGQSAAGTR